MNKPTIFIGSSSEGLETARAIKQQFDAEADVDLWNEGVFKLNASYLESLLRAVNLYDFAILVSGGVQHVPCRGCGGEWTFALAVAFCPAKDKAEAQSQAADGASR